MRTTPHKTVGVVRGTVKGAVAGDDVNISGRVGGWSCTRHPYRTFGARGSDIPNANLRQRCRTIGKKPSVVRRVVSMGAKANVDVPVSEQEAGTLHLFQRLPTGRGDDCRTTPSFRTGDDVQRMQSEYYVAALQGFPGHVKRASRRVNHRSACNSNLGKDGAADKRRRHRGCSSWYDADLPQGRTSLIGVECVHRIVFCGYEDDVVDGAANRKLGHIEWLRGHRPLFRIAEKNSEASGIDVCGSEECLLRLLSRSQIVVLPCRVIKRASASALDCDRRFSDVISGIGSSNSNRTVRSSCRVQS